MAVSYKPLFHSAAVSATTENLLEFSLTGDLPLFPHQTASKCVRL